MGARHMSTQLRRPATALRFAAAFATLSLRAADAMALWQERTRQRRTLGRLNDHMLKDLGLSRADAGREGGKRFWQD